MDATQKMMARDRALDEFEKGVGVPPTYPTANINEVHRLMALSREDLGRMNEAECAESASILFSFAFHLQKSANREVAREKGLEYELWKMVGAEIATARAYSPEERRALVVSQNDAARKVEELRMASRLKLDRIAFYANRVQALAESLMNLKRTKGRY